MTKITKAMVMAAGFGTRMRPLTNTIPKPLVPFLGKPLIDWCMDLLRSAGTTDFVVNSHYLADKIHGHFSDDPRVQISHEDEILETGGGMKKALPLLGQDAVFVANADVVLIGDAEKSLNNLLSHWDDEKMDCLMLLIPKEKAFGHGGAGDYFMDEMGGLTRRIEEDSAPYIFSSYRIMHPRLLDDTPDGAFSLRDSFDKAQAAGRLFGVVHDGEWLDISSVKSLEEAESHYGSRLVDGKII
ncbi:nucleotidyltransferase family protein [Curvivirga sp.]|uniref:nucleotidyltransferase family protein n=1 Tax=Curvivirga sp. TaxID=2856848 RepID=UPI003B5C9889